MRWLLLIFAASLCWNGIDLYADCAPRPAGLVSWWAGDGDYSDIIGTNHGTFNWSQSPTFVSGKVGQAFSFDGNDYVTIGNPADLKLTNAITVEGWVNPTNFAEGQIAAILTKWGQSNSFDSFGLYLEKQGGVIHALSTIGTPGPDDQLLLNGVVPANTWSHVAMTYDAGSGVQVLFVNGAVAATNLYPGGMIASDAKVTIGWEDSNAPRHFTGLLDEISIYNRALSVSEIAAIYNADAGGKCKGDLPQIDLRILQTLSTNVVLFGSNLVWTLVATNQGNRTATGISLGANFPDRSVDDANVAEISSNPPGFAWGILGCMGTNCWAVQIAFPFETIPAGGSVTGKLVFKFMTNGLFTLSSVVSANERESVATNNTDSLAVIVHSLAEDVVIQTRLAGEFVVIDWQDRRSRPRFGGSPHYSLEETETLDDADSWRRIEFLDWLFPYDDYYTYSVPVSGRMKFFRVREIIE
jgi:hypothetical protein